jgi:hypothetical protein
MEMFSLRKLNKVEGKDHCHVEVSNRLTALEDLDTEVVNSIRETIQIAARESLG